MPYDGPIPVLSAYSPTFERYTVVNPTLGNTGSTNSRKTIVPNNRFWRVVAASWSYFCGATVANRIASFVVFDRIGSQILTARAPGILVANSTGSFVVAPGVSSYTNTGLAGASGMQWPIPDIIYPSGYAFDMRIDNVQVGDSFSSVPDPTLFVEEYIDVGEKKEDTTFLQTLARVARLGQ